MYGLLLCLIFALHGICRNSSSATTSPFVLYCILYGLEKACFIAGYRIGGRLLLFSIDTSGTCRSGMYLY